jgi:phosphatidylglycerol:prolipoprotein diacylglycerol transferase
MSNIFISIGSINIYWYSVLILVAVIIGSYIVIKETPRRNISLTYMTDLIFYLIPVSIIGARTYYVVFNFKLYQNNLLDIFKIWEGGLAIYGAIIAAIIFIFYYSKKKGQNFIATLDVMVPSLILGQAIGRWGNFFNQEAYGKVTTLTHLKELHIPKFIINNMYINNIYYTPTFLYESLLCLIGFIILMLVRKKNRNKQGMQLALYFIIYGVSRFFIEGLREDSLYFLGFRISQIVSIILVVIGVLIVVNYYIQKKKIGEDKVNVRL